MGCGASRAEAPAIPDAKASAAVNSAAAAERGGPAPAAAEAGATADVALAPPQEAAKPKDAIKVKAWVGNAGDGTLPFPELSDEDFEVPVLKDKCDTAVCISGGGFRASTLGLGWLRALNHLGLLSKVKYLCTCSGSAWLGAALCFARGTTTGTFLGHHFPPEMCDLDTLARVGDKGRSYGAAMADAEPLIDYVKAQLQEAVDGDDGSKRGVQETRAWTRAMAAAFLAPFGLGDTDASTTSMTGTKSGIHSTTAVRGAKVGRGQVHLANPQLPYLVIAQVLLLPNDPQLYYPYEWTPLYSGCPVPYSSTQPRLGGGWVEAVGYNAVLAEKPAHPVAPGSALTVSVRPTGPASLGEAIGISSAYNSYKWAMGKTSKGRAAHKLLGFHTGDLFDMQEWDTNQMQLTDGGGSDYHAIYPALRRRVANIIVLSASKAPIEDYEKFTRDMRDIPGLFGCWPGNDRDTKGLAGPEFNKQRQVFAEGADGYKRLYQALLAKFQAGEAAVHADEYEVMANPAMGVPGGWRVRVLWVINEVQRKWEEALPADTRDKLHHDRTSFAAKVEEGLNPLDADTFQQFPLVSTFAFNYPPELVGLMAAHAAHMLTSNKALVEGMMPAPPPRQM
ncbi:hypothetical protein CHLRE_12g534050v5 [Chlamydomonas reinhardtii]|uniref:Uncharacterized protein n=1 Tax=Chlamydomonas reinhardtii TaxID=3055 RepID=A0A2K3D506_CHLRE|nr:uncharacterized protein CHLRE_12g534050v5 [Chlamydomonas reinhardtii]PNW75616.1 hypothetical protein CHLRE_12g534050v5 [Chlamydomonas reinhardtii]